MTFRFSRSHVSTDQECSRKLYLGYYYAGSGVERRGLNLDKELGILVHDILGRVLKGEELETAIEEASLTYQTKVTKRGFEFALDEEKLEFEVKRQLALGEALSRAWVKVRLPYYLENGKIEFVEKEHNVPVGDGIELMTRIDAIWRRNDGTLWAGPEFKTQGYISQQSIEAWRYSSQILTHLRGAESLLGEKVQGVKMEFLYKGTKRNDDCGETTYYSPLLRGALKIGSNPPEYAFSSDAARKKGWRAFEAWRELGVKNWLDILPLPVLESQLYYSDVMKDDNIVNQWLEQQRMRQDNIRTGLEMVREGVGDDFENAMDEIFPARLDSWCYANQYKKRCQFLGVCYGEVVGDLLDNGYVRREAHHAQEREFEV